MNPPQTVMVATSIQIPHMEALGQGQPAGEVLGVVHGDEHDAGLVCDGEVVWVTRGLVIVGHHTRLS